MSANPEACARLTEQIDFAADRRARRRRDARRARRRRARAAARRRVGHADLRRDRRRRRRGGEPPRSVDVDPRLHPHGAQRDLTARSRFPPRAVPHVGRLRRARRARHRRRAARLDARRIGQGRIAGFALPVRLEPKSNDPSAYRFGGGVGKPLEQVLQTMKDGDVVVMDLGGSDRAAAWGGLASRIAQRRGVRGTIMWGACRDVDEIRAIGYPVWSAACARAAAATTSRSAGSTSP